MKTLFFCNLIPLKTGAFETLLATIGTEFKKAPSVGSGQADSTGLRQAGDEFVVVFAGEPIPAVAESLRAAGVRWHILKEWAEAPGKERAWGFILPALRLLRQERPDVTVVHFGNELPTLAAIVLARLTGLGKVKWVWQQDQQIKDPGRIGKHLSRLRLLSFFADHFVAVYEGGRLSMLMRGIPADKITVIHNSVALYTPTKPKGWLRHELGIGPEEILLVTNGSLIPRKRIDFILRACAMIRNGCLVETSLTPEPLNPLTPNSCPWRLLVIGEGPERERLGALAEKLGIAERVHFLGLRNDVREILPECNIYLHASKAETCTYAVTESMAAGIPAVMLNAGAAKEQIHNGISGFVFDLAEIEPFARTLYALMVDPGRRVEMGKRAESRWKTAFRVERAAGRYRDLYVNTSRGEV